VPILIRVNSNKSLGNGHFYRCLAIALRARELGIDSIFTGSSISKEATLRLSEFEFKLELHSENRKESGSPAHQIIPLINKYNIKVIIIDDKDIRLEDEHKIMQRGVKIIAIVDRAIRFHETDILLSPNFFNTSEPFLNMVPRNCEILTGPTFIPLRPEFRESKPSHPKVNKVTNIGSFFGGSDPGNQSALILETATDPRFSDLNFHILTGSLNPGIEALYERARNLKNVFLLKFDSNMANYWNKVDIAFGSFGISAWERCATGVPSVATIQSEDQIMDAEVLSNLGAVMSLGLATEITSHVFSETLNSIRDDKNFLNSLSQNSMQVMNDSIKDSNRIFDFILSQQYN